MSNGNLICRNSFIDEDTCDNADNNWNDEMYGNYWSDYETKYPDAKKRPFWKIWDTPYEIPGGENKDRYPLINEWTNSVSRTIPRHQILPNPFFMRLFERFSNAFPILRILLL